MSDVISSTVLTVFTFCSKLTWNFVRSSEYFLDTQISHFTDFFNGHGTTRLDALDYKILRR